MAFFGTLVLYVTMACAVSGCIVSIFWKEQAYGKQFLEGVETLGSLFIPVAGVMAALPFLTKFVLSVTGPLFALFGSDPSMAATTFIATDMGGYQLSHAVMGSKESWAVAICNGLMAGATIVFSFPIAMKVLPEKNHNALALGMLFGFISIPFGVFISALSLKGVAIRPDCTVSGDASYVLHLTTSGILRDLCPLLVICFFFAIVLRLFPRGTVRVAKWCGTMLDAALRIVFVLCVVQYFTHLFPFWKFDPIIADATDTNRALEMCGYIAIMLSGAYPMVYLLSRWFSAPLGKLGKRFGFSGLMVTGLLASLANSIALFRLVPQMDEDNQVEAIAFSVGASFMIGDHLAFIATWQPTMLAAVMAGKLSSGIIALTLSRLYLKKRSLSS